MKDKTIFSIILPLILVLVASFFVGEAISEETRVDYTSAELISLSRSDPTAVLNYLESSKTIPLEKFYNARLMTLGNGHGFILEGKDFVLTAIPLIESFPDQSYPPATVEGYKINERYILVSSIPKLSSKRAIASNLPLCKGDRSILFAWIDWSDKVAVDSSKPSLETLNARFASLTNTLEIGSFNQLNIVNYTVIAGPLRMSSKYPEQGGGPSALMEEAKALLLSDYGIDADSYDIFGIGFPTIYAWGGQGTSGGSRGLFWLNGGYSSDRVFLHEIGHNFGLGHANSIMCSTPRAFGGDTCSSVNQNEPHDYMGNGQMQYNFIHKRYLNYVDDTMIINVTSPGTYDIHPFDIVESYGQKMALLISHDPSQGTSYVVSFRNENGGLSMLQYGAVEIHMITGAIDGKATTEMLNSLYQFEYNYRFSPLRLGFTFFDDTGSRRVYLTMTKRTCTNGKCVASVQVRFEDLTAAENTMYTQRIVPPMIGWNYFEVPFPSDLKVATCKGTSARFEFALNGPYTDYVHFSSPIYMTDWFQDEGFVPLHHQEPFYGTSQEYVFYVFSNSQGQNYRPFDWDWTVVCGLSSISLSSVGGDPKSLSASLNLGASGNYTGWWIMWNDKIVSSKEGAEFSNQLLATIPTSSSDYSLVGVHSFISIVKDSLGPYAFSSFSRYYEESFTSLPVITITPIDSSSHEIKLVMRPPPSGKAVHFTAHMHAPTISLFNPSLVSGKDYSIINLATVYLYRVAQFNIHNKMTLSNTAEIELEYKIQGKCGMFGIGLSQSSFVNGGIQYSIYGNSSWCPNCSPALASSKVLVGGWNGIRISSIGSVVTSYNKKILFIQIYAPQCEVTVRNIRIFESVSTITSAESGLSPSPRDLSSVYSTSDVATKTTVSATGNYSLSATLKGTTYSYNIYVKDIDTNGYVYATLDENAVTPAKNQGACDFTTIDQCQSDSTCTWCSSTQSCEYSTSTCMSQSDCPNNNQTSCNLDRTCAWCSSASICLNLNQYCSPPVDCKTFSKDNCTNAQCKVCGSTQTCEQVTAKCATQSACSYSTGATCLADNTCNWCPLSLSCTAKSKSCLPQGTCNGTFADTCTSDPTCQWCSYTQNCAVLSTAGACFKMGTCTASTTKADCLSTNSVDCWWLPTVGCIFKKYGNPTLMNSFFWYGSVSYDTPNWQERQLNTLINVARMSPTKFSNTYTSLSSFNGSAVDPLYEHYELDRAARSHSNDMSSKGCFSDTDCNGWYSMDGRVRNYYTEPGTQLAELIDNTDTSAVASMKRWFESSSSRSTIMNSSFKVVGAGYVSNKWTQNFAVGTQNITSPISSGAHFYLNSTHVSFFVTVYNATQNANNQGPYVQLSLDGVLYDMDLLYPYGDDPKSKFGTFGLTIPKLASGSCRNYVFIATDALNNMFYYPKAGSLQTNGEGSCSTFFYTCGGLTSSGCADNGCKWCAISKTCLKGILSTCPTQGACSANTSSSCTSDSTCQWCSYGTVCMAKTKICPAVPSCSGILATKSSVCSGNGVCQATDTCVCKNGYSGVDCSIQTCNGVPANNVTVCSGNGNCTAIDTCTCKKGYIGSNCESPIPCTLSCVHGKCLNETGIATCQCDSEYEGTLCAQKIPNPCILKCAHGKCINETGNAYCECESGFEGLLCQNMSINPCLLPCVNGSCNNDTGIAVCRCVEGYEGTLCNLRITNPCKLDCVHGKCLNETGIAKCECDSGFEGSLCESKMSNPCTLKCVHGSCINDTGSATCKCDSGFEGTLCAQKSSNPCTLACVNGNCLNETGVASCKCFVGYEGELCDSKIPNPCTLKCVNGKCLNETGTATCECLSGFEGNLCEKKSINPCTLDCVNGNCVNTTGNAICKCDSGYEGSLCEKKSTNPCTLDCVNGNCHNETGTATCKCVEGFEGTLCETKTPNPCILKCLNGNCLNETGTAQCKCFAGYEGPLCGVKSPNPCTIKCINGNCLNETGVASCKCFVGYEGELCEAKSPNPCTLKCLNGNCFNETGVASCRCAPGFEGALCETKSPNPCNLDCVNGNCINVTGMATCKCVEGFEGTLCEIKTANPSLCECFPGYEGPLCGVKSPNPCALKCLNGNCLNETGVASCKCFPGYEGPLCGVKSPNPCTLKCVNGNCLNETGTAVCNCLNGYEGTLCEKKSTNPCTLACINGNCVNITGNAICKCDSGYEGSLCEKKSTNPCTLICLNSGQCKNETGNATCQCATGFSGARCEQQDCKLSCLNGGVCSIENNSPICKCAGLFEGVLCGSCKPGFILQNRDCVCAEGYENVENTCVRLPPSCSPTCGQFGNCVYRDTFGNKGECKCQKGYTTLNSTKPCSSCDMGYSLNDKGLCTKTCVVDFYGDDCTVYSPAPKCMSVNPSSDLSFCKAYIPSIFSVLSTNYIVGATNVSDARSKLLKALTRNDVDASNRYNSILKNMGQCDSTCDLSLRRYVCYTSFKSCIVNQATKLPEERLLCKSTCQYMIENEMPSGLSSISCSDLPTESCFYGSYLSPSTTCYGKSYNDSTVCNSNGFCTGQDTCSCKQGFSGSQCITPSCFGKYADQTGVCSGNGQCQGPNQCKCNAGYAGIECTAVTCNGKTELEGGCSFHGSCSASTHTCSCNGNFAGVACSSCKEGFTGPLCDVCNGIKASDKDVCGGRGSCISEYGIPTCKCSEGYEGTSCQSFKCNGIDRSSTSVCSSNGKCVNLNSCQCKGNFDSSTFCSQCLPSYNGTDCSNRMCDPKTTCKGRGTCNSLNTCVCSGKFAGQFCEKCVDGWVGDNCDFQCSAATKCSGKGTCSSTGTCVCSGNSEGSDCSTCKSGWFGIKCDFSVVAGSFGFNENGDIITANIYSSIKKRFDCSELITNASPLLGKNPACSLDGEKSLLTIQLGTEATIIPGSSLIVKKYFGLDATQTVTLSQGNYISKAPVASLISDKSTISKACGSLYLDASGSSSVDRRPLVFSWSTTVGPTQQDIDMLDSLIKSSSKSGVKFVASDLGVGSYSVQVSVTSSFSSAQSVASVSFTVIDASPPTLTIKNGAESNMVIGTPYIISPVVSFPSCYKGSANPANLKFTYSLTQGNSLDIKQKNELLVFSNEYTKITEEGDYYFTLTAKEDNSPQATVSFKITATALPLKVAFNIREMTQSFEDPVKFVVLKEDPSNPTSTDGTVALACINMDTAAICEGFNLDGTKNIDQSTLSYSSSMNPGVYLFTATFAKSTRSSTTSVKVTVSEQTKSTVLRVSIIGPSNADLNAIDPSSDLVLQMTSLDVMTKARTFEWSIPDFIDSSIIRTNKYITIPKSLLAPGASYTVSVKVIDGYKSGEASLTFTINAPPTLGTLEISPSTGVALSDEFKISCGNGWTDSQLPLTFKFMFKDQSETSWKVLQEQSETRSFGTSLPAGKLEIKAIVFDSKGASTETITTVSVTMPKDASSALSALTSASTATMTTSSISSALSVIQSIQTDDPEAKKKLSEVGSQFVLSYFTQKAAEESVSSQTTASTTSSLSVISSISSCADNLPDDIIRMIIEKFRSAVDGASSSSSISLSNDEVSSSLSSADTLQTYISGNLARRSIMSGSFTADDLAKIDQVKKSLVDVKLKNAVPDMPAERALGAHFASYVRLVSISTLNNLFDTVKDNGTSSFNLSSSFGSLPQIAELESIKLSVGISDFTNSTVKVLSKILSLVVSSSNSEIVVSQEGESIATLTIERIPQTVRMARTDSVVCRALIDGNFIQSTNCSIISANYDSYTIVVSSTGSFVLTMESTSVNPTPTIPTPGSSVQPIIHPISSFYIDYAAVGVGIGVVVCSMIVVAVVVVFCIVVRKKKIQNKDDDVELKETV